MTLKILSGIAQFLLQLVAKFFGLIDVFEFTKLSRVLRWENLITFYNYADDAYYCLPIYKSVMRTVYRELEMIHKIRMLPTACAFDSRWVS